MPTMTRRCCPHMHVDTPLCMPPPTSCSFSTSSALSSTYARLLCTQFFPTFLQEAVSRTSYKRLCLGLSTQGLWSQGNGIIAVPGLPFSQHTKIESMIRSHPAENVCTVVNNVREVVPTDHGEKWSTPNPPLVPLHHRPLQPKIPLLVPPLCPGLLLQHTPSPALNPDATPFSPSSTPGGFVGDELPDWLAFTQSSSEGRSPTPGCFSSIPLSVSFVNVVCNKGKVPMEPAGQNSTVDRIKGKVPTELDD
jgi:hypothetical protein